MDLAIPTMETQRLSLRPFREADVVALFELLQEPDVFRFVGDRREPTLQETWRGHRLLVYGISRGDWEARPQ